MTKIDWENITNYIESVGSTDTVFPFKKPQSSVTVTARGARDNIIYTIGGQSGTLTPGQSVTITGSITTMTLRSASGTQPFQVWAVEAGTEKDEPETDFTTQLAQIAINVKSKGAKGDGVTDDTVAIQSAIDYATANGYGKVYFPDGTYLISSTLQVNSKIALIGQSKVNTIIQTNTDINMIDLHVPCELIGFTFSINLLLHSKSIIRYFAIQGGNKNGLVRDIYIIGLDGYQNTTKAIEFVQENGTTGTKSWLMFWTFENIYIEFCDTAWYTQADFTLCWTTGCTFKNVIVERCKRAVWFNTTYLPGYFSRYDFIEWQFQCNTSMNRAFEAPADRAIIDMHIWDRPSFPATPASIYIKGTSKNNVFKFRNIDTTQIQFEKPYSIYQNRFEFTDDKMSKNIMPGAGLYVDPVNGNDSTGDGSQTNPYRTIAQVLNYLPTVINGNSVTINLTAGTFNESINLSNYDGGGIINIIGAGSTTILTGYINVNSNRVKLSLKNMTIQGNNGGTAVQIVDSEYTILDGVNVNPSATITTGIYIQATRAMVRNNNITNCTTAINATTQAQVRIDSVTGSGNTTGYLASNGSYIGYTTAQPGGFATTPYSKASGGIIVSNTGLMQAATQSNSVAADVPTLVTDFNNLLSKLKSAGLML